jgi:hypothetical protein
MTDCFNAFSELASAINPMAVNLMTYDRTFAVDNAYLYLFELEVLQ